MMDATLRANRLWRLRVTIRGAVQGVGFRPFIYRLATDLALAGWVNNSSQGVFIEVEGKKEQLEAFLLRIGQEKPPRAFIQSLEPSWLDPVGYSGFEIRHSDEAGGKTALILPDIATCADCLREINDLADRRFQYPFTNCTNCGPRFSIIEALPYDRAKTTMRRFTMCPACQAEYDDPRNRRFHAQPNACPVCGPHLKLWDGTGKVLASHHQALLVAADAIRQGMIVAIKGLGGFHLMVDARREESVRQLRQRKHREEKPLALMYPSLAWVKAHCAVSELEERLLQSPESPIVLLRRHKAVAPGWAEIAPAVAPRNPYLGVMLPYTPLHHLLLAELGFPVVATSGNLSDEPICTDEREALERLQHIADVFLVHNRPIARHVDDSIVRVIMGRELLVRRARGYAPLPISLKEPLPPLLATGGHLKNTVATSVGREVMLSQHIGDLETAQAFQAFQRAVVGLTGLYEISPVAVACDAHPDYRSTQFARESGLPVITVQHHYAHVLACMAENELEGPVLGVSWDGTGYGLDGTIWGGEFLRVTETSFSRVAHLRCFRLPGGERAIKEPRRAAIGLLHELLGDALFLRGELAPVRAFTAGEREVLRTMLRKGVNAPLTSSAGRLFDAVAALVGLRQHNSFEGQAAMELEFALDDTGRDERYNLELTESKGDNQAIIVDWVPMVGEILDDLHFQVPVGEIARRFHHALAEAIVAVARRIGEERVVLTGGCFQNRELTEQAVRRLKDQGFRPYWHQRVPPNDGGLALGQIVAAARLQPKG
ncbi:MAG: carbamoyltransferase HypF [Deinococcus sp.]|nr:carbamoyltransferase HypF [Deinococcus sp.]